LSRVFAFILPSLALSIMIYTGGNQSSQFALFLKGIFNEGSLLFFGLKAVVLLLVCFTSAVLISNKMEVQI